MTGAGASTGLVGSARALRHGGVACGPERVQAFVAAVDLLDVARREDAYRAGRVALCGEPDDLPRCDAAFTAWFGGALPEPPGGRPRRTGHLAALGKGTAKRDRPAPTLEVAPSDAEVVRRKDTAALRPTEKRHLNEGGTRLGGTIEVFLDRRGQRGAARRLGRLAHQVVRVNPHAGREGCEPARSGIVAALPHLDRLLDGSDAPHALLEEVRRA